MARKTPSVLIADIVTGYLQATIAAYDATDANIAELALSSTVTGMVRRMDDGTQIEVPMICVQAAESGETSGARRTVSVMVRFYTTLPGGASDTKSTERTHTLDAATTILDVIERRLRQRTAFSGYINSALSSGDREGWAIMSMRTTRPEAIDRAEEKLAPNALILAVNAEITLAWSR